MEKYKRCTNEFILKGNRRMKQKKEKALSQKEIKVIELIAGGFTDDEIAAELKLSYSTIRMYAMNLLNKTNSSNRANLIYWAFTNGVLNNKN